jgi:hypothetical protein
MTTTDDDRDPDGSESLTIAEVTQTLFLLQYEAQKLGHEELTHFLEVAAQIAEDLAHAELLPAQAMPLQAPSTLQ